jgi:prophage antirepressor-like protein
MKTKQPTERQNCQITPFTYEDHAVRTVMIDNEPWFIAKDVCDVLGIARTSDALRDFPENEKGTVDHRTPGGNQEMLTVNEPGLYRLIFQSRKPEAEKFKAWVFNEVLPQIRKTGSYGPPEREGEACAGKIYRLFSAAHDMTIQRINKVIYYFALDPPLSNMDIAKLLGASDSTVSLWRKRLAPEAARAAVKALGLSAQGIAAGKAASPLELPAKGAQDE